MKRKLAWTLAAASLFSAATSSLSRTRRTTSVRRDEDRSIRQAVVMLDERTPLMRPRGPTYVGNLWVTEASPPDFSWSADRARRRSASCRRRAAASFAWWTFRRVRGARASGLGHHAGCCRRRRHAGEGRAAAPSADASHAHARLRDHHVGRDRHAARRGRGASQAGDVVVQQATNHAWVNRGREPLPHRVHPARLPRTVFRSRSY